MFWNDNELVIEPYDKIKKVYFCGKELLQFKEQKSLVYRILVIDYDDCCLAEVYTDGEIVTIFNHHSDVPHKHKCGGQSAARFSRIRQEAIKQWFKRINQYLKQIDGEIIVGISPIYKKRFASYLDSYNQQKIKDFRNTEYANISGIYQMVTKLEKEKS